LINASTNVPLSPRASKWVLLGVLALAMLAWSPKIYGAKVFAQMGPGFVFGETTMPGVSTSFLGRVTSNGPAFVGVDTGVFFATGSANFGMAIPIVPYLIYFFPTRDLFKPWLGFGFGALLGFGSGANTDFVIFFKPGMRVSVNRQVDVFLEARLGLVGATLAFAPVVGAMFAL
jgi:hypothetical protein